MKRTILPLLTLVAGFASSAICSPAQADSSGWTRTNLRVKKHDQATDFEFDARYEGKTRGRRSKSHLDVRVWDGEPFSAHDVAVNGLMIGQVFIDESGNGRLKLRERDLSELLPDFLAGDYVTVGTIGGAFEHHGRGGDRDSKRNKTSRLRLRDGYEDESGLEIHAKYETRTRKGKMERRFKVSMEFGLDDADADADADGEGEDDDDDPVSAHAGETYPIFVNGEHLGDIVIDDDGEGKLDFRCRNANIDLFPMLQAGDVVLVGDLVELVLN